LHRIIIPGPPGTGKTHRLMQLLDNELNLVKTDPEKIAYIAFSNAAANVAKERIKNDKIYVSTMHSMGTKECNINTKTQLLKGDKWKNFKNFSSYCRDLNFESRININGYVEHTNPHMRIIELARNKKISIEEAAVELELHYSTDIWLTEQIAADLKTYKDSTGMIEYSDMISKFVEEDRCPPLHCVFLDEAQDLSPLQWDMFFYIESKCARSYIAGDDDQTIYSFQGASPKIFINLKGRFDPQVQSRRVPRSVHKLATSIFPHMSQRLEKEWRPREAEGVVNMGSDFEELPLQAEHGLRATGSWEQLNFPESSKLYIKKLLESGDNLMKPARIKLSTIHGVKGEECDNVVLFTDIERIIYESATRNPDPEHRLFFVGITRAKERLYICSQHYEYQYNIGGPIV
jgi:superfamily I DNA/RNA helicase